MSGTVGSLFTGCGGLDLGLEAAGWEIAWACENDEACRRVIGRRRPDLAVVPDVREIDEGMPPVDLLAGGFPCQDLSYAGRGAGLDGDRSGLWFEYARAIRLLRPRLVLVENVPGLATRGLGRVLYDLAEAGYVGSWLRLGAADVGAPHRRDRIFIVAAADAERLRIDADGGLHRRGARAFGRPAPVPVPAGAEVARATDAEPHGGGAAADAGGMAGPPTGERDRRPGAGGESRARGHEGQEVTRVAGCAGTTAADADGAGRGEHGGSVAVGAAHAAAQHGGDRVAADAVGERRHGWPDRQQGDGAVGQATAGYEGVDLAARGDHTQAAADADERGSQVDPQRVRRRAGVGAGRSARGHDADGRDELAATDADLAGREAERAQRGRGAAQPSDDVGDDGPSPVWGPYEPAIRRWEAILERAAPRPTDDRGRLNPEFVEWMLGFPDGWTEGERRTHRLRMLGNSVQVQCGELVGRLLAEAL